MALVWGGSATCLEEFGGGAAAGGEGGGRVVEVVDHRGPLVEPHAALGHRGPTATPSHGARRRPIIRQTAAGSEPIAEEGEGGGSWAGDSLPGAFRAGPPAAPHRDSIHAPLAGATPRDGGRGGRGGREGGGGGGEGGRAAPSAGAAAGWGCSGIVRGSRGRVGGRRRAGIRKPEAGPETPCGKGGAGPRVSRGSGLAWLWPVGRRRRWVWGVYQRVRAEHTHTQRSKARVENAKPAI